MNKIITYGEFKYRAGKIIKEVLSEIKKPRIRQYSREHLQYVLNNSSSEWINYRVCYERRFL